VLFLHDWPTSSSLWREVMRRIARANRVVALDLRGFGASGIAVHDLGGPSSDCMGLSIAPAA
jgi:pimeloyl-ACP methyl ester carboxylesterase